jgi:hypothetical protein
LEAVKEKVALKGYVNPATGEITIDWKGDERKISARLNAGGGIEHTASDLEHWLTRI